MASPRCKASWSSFSPSLDSEVFSTVPPYLAIPKTGMEQQAPEHAQSPRRRPDDAGHGRDSRRPLSRTITAIASGPDDEVLPAAVPRQRRPPRWSRRRNRSRSGQAWCLPSFLSWGFAAPAPSGWWFGVAALFVDLGRCLPSAPGGEERDRDDQAGHPGNHQDHSDDLQVHVGGFPGDAELENGANND
jgi:hypothetical protein